MSRRHAKGQLELPLVLVQKALHRHAYDPGRRNVIRVGQSLYLEVDVLRQHD
ncbi:hypothetical protein [Pseudomonas synxantha]|uniref:hypothetical protein n=1 Tax=Pseudomonas synxantha TaxID=47883 RepID=UPI001652D4FC|nr:hypothetical protein [Pseudomonas synxantha]